MNSFYKVMLIFISFSTLPSITMAGTPLPIEPPPLFALPLKAGSWVISYYQAPNEHAVTGTSNICVRSDNSWYMEPADIPGNEKRPSAPMMFTQGGNGEWLIDANNVTLYSSAPGHNAAAFTAIGQLYGDSLISGRYVNYGISRNSPKVVSGSFQASYQSVDCSF
jgi:hypothetical protein